MTEALYLQDSYMKEFSATVVSVAEGKFVVLDKTAFYPQGGGQPCDTGKLIRESDGKEFKVVFAKKFGTDISHEISPEGLAAGDKVRGIIDWGRRHNLMRMHTAAHLLSAILNGEHGAMITGNQLDIDTSRMDFSLENFDRSLLDAACKKANELIEQNLPVKTYFLPSEEALKIPNVAKLAAPGHFPDAPELRIVEIEGVDKQLDGGTHVRSLGEIGKIEIVRAENKGKNNRRAYFRIG